MDHRPEVELELWKFISFPVSERQFLLTSGSTPPCGVKQLLGKSKAATRVQSIQERDHNKKE